MLLSRTDPHLTHFSLKFPKLSILPIPSSHGQSQFVSIGPWCFKVDFVCIASWTRSESPVLFSHGLICATKESMVNGSGLHVQKIKMPCYCCALSGGLIDDNGGNTNANGGTETTNGTWYNNLTGENHNNVINIPIVVRNPRSKKPEKLKQFLWWFSYHYPFSHSLLHYQFFTLHWIITMST